MEVCSGSNQYLDSLLLGVPSSGGPTGCATVAGGGSALLRWLTRLYVVTSLHARPPLHAASGTSSTLWHPCQQLADECSA